MSLKIKISLTDADELTKFIKSSIVRPMEKKITGNIKIHLLEGEIRGVELNYMSRNLAEIRLIVED